MFTRHLLTVFLSATLCFCSIVVAKQADQNILAQFKNHQITETELSEFCKEITGKALQDLPSPMKKLFLEAYIKKIVLEESARASKIEKTEEYKKHFQSYSKIFLVEFFINKKVQERLTDGAIESSYKSLIQDLKEKGELRLQYLFFTSNEQALANLAKMKSGKSFADVSKDLQKENKSPKTLEMKFFRPYDMFSPQILLNNAFKLGANQYSDVIATNQGFYIVNVIEKREVKQMPSFAELKYQIKEKLETQYREELEENLIKQADIKKFADY